MDILKNDIYPTLFKTLDMVTKSFVLKHYFNNIQVVVR